MIIKSIRIAWYSILLLILFQNTLSAGLTFAEKHRLLFEYGGGFEAISTTNASGQSSTYIQLIDYDSDTDPSAYMSKGIEFSGTLDGSEVSTTTNVPISSAIYQLIPTTVRTGNVGLSYQVGDCDADNNISCGPNLTLRSGATGRMEIDIGENKLIDVDSSNTGDTFWQDRGITNMTKGFSDDYYAKMIVGSSAEEFYAFDSPTAATVTLTANITLFKVSQDGSDGRLDVGSIKLSTNERPVFIGKATANHTILSLYPKFITNADTEDSEVRIGINTNKVDKSVTVSGNFQVTGTLAATGDLGVLKQNAGTTQTSNPNDICIDYTLDLVTHNVILLGSVSSSPVSGRHSFYNIWIDIEVDTTGNGSYTFMPYQPAKSAGGNYFDETNTIKQKSLREMDGSTSQNSSSLVTQLVSTWPGNPYNLSKSYADLDSANYRACVGFSDSDGSFNASGDQNQIIVLGLPSDTLQGLPFTEEEYEGESIEETSIQTGEMTISHFTENTIVLEPKAGGDPAGISASGYFMSFTDGQDVVPFKASKVKADAYYKINVLKVISEESDTEGTVFRINKKASTGQTGIDFRIAEESISAEGPKGPLGFDGNDNLSSNGERLTHYSISTSDSTGLLLNDSIDILSGDFISFVKDSSTNTGRIDLSKSGSASYALSTIGDIVFTGTYIGNIGKMFWFKCDIGAYNKQSGFDTDGLRNNISGTNDNGNFANALVIPASLQSTDYTDCYHDIDNPSITIPAAKLTTPSPSEIGYKLIILSTFSAKTTGEYSTKIDITLENAGDTTLNGNACGSTCSSDAAYFSGDSHANSYYQYNNMAVLNKVRGNQEVTIGINASGGLKTDSDSRENGGGSSILILALPQAL